MAKPWVEIGRYGSVGIELVLTIFIPAAIGHWLDTRYGSKSGWRAAIGFVLGAAAGFRNLIRTAKGMQADIERAEAKDPEAGRWRVDESWLHDNAPPASPTDDRPRKSNPPDGKDGAPN